MAEVAAIGSQGVDVLASSEDEYESSDDSNSVSSYDDGHGRSSEETRSKKDDGSLPDAVVSEAVKKLLQGASEKTDTSQHGDGTLIEAVVGEFKLPTGHRFYNWNSSHFYPDVHHPLDVRSQLRQRRHSEPQPRFRFVDSDSNDSDRSNSESGSSSGSEIEIINARPGNQDSRTSTTTTTMPLSAISFQLVNSLPKVDDTMKVDVDIDSGSDVEDDDDPKTWHRSPLRRIKSDTFAKKPATIPSSQDPTSSRVIKLNFERPSIRSKQQAEKRREFLRLRCRSQGWDLDASPGVEQQRSKIAASPVSSSRSVGSLSLSGSISRSQEDIRYVEQSPEWSVRGRDALDGVSPDLTHIDVRGRIRQFEPEKKVSGVEAVLKKVNVNNNVVTSNCQFHFDGMKMIDDQDQTLSGSAVYYSPNSSTAGSFRKTASSFENIYDSVNLEPEIPAVSEVIELYEQQSHRIMHKECRLPVSSQNLPSQSAPVTKPALASDSTKSDSTPATKSKLDAKSIVEEEKIKFIDYRIEYRRQHSSGNESGSGRSSDEKDRKKSNASSSSGDVSKAVKIIPPDDYEYILRKIHHSRQDSVPKEMQRSGTGSSLPIDQSQNRRQHGGSLRTYAEVKKAMETAQHQSSGDRLTTFVDSKTLSARPNDLESDVSNVRSRPLSATHRPPPEPISIAPIAPDRSHSLSYGERLNDGRSKTQPDLIPSPIRTSVAPVYRQAPATVSNQPLQPVTNNKTKWDETSFPMHFDVSVGCPQPLSISIQPTSVPGKPEWKPPQNENFPPPPDFWNYNTSYEPSSPKSPTVHSPKPVSNTLPFLHRETRQEIPHHHRTRDDLVHDLVRSLDNNTELPAESAAVFKEQYRFSIQAPVIPVKPEQIEQSYHSPTYRAEDQPKRILAPMPRSQITRHRQQRMANYEPLVESSDLPASHRRFPYDDQWNNSSFPPAADSPNSSSSIKATVFSLTGFHKPAMQATPTQLPLVPPQSETLYWQSQQPSDAEFYLPADGGFPSRQYDLPPPISPDIYSEPMYWGSDANKRRPIVNCPEVETALNLDSQQQQQRYFYCSGRQLHGTDLAASGDNPSSVVHQSTIPADNSAYSIPRTRLQQQPQPATVHVPDSQQQQPDSYYGYDFLFSVPSYQKTNGKDVKVWQQTSTPVHLTNTPVQVQSPVRPGAPVQTNSTIHLPHEDSYVNVKPVQKPMETGSWIQPESQAMLPDRSLQQQPTHERLPSSCLQSRASNRYEKHIANEQENYKAQISAHTDEKSPQEMITDSQTSKSDMSVQIIPNAGPKSPGTNQTSIPSWSWTFDPVEQKLDLDRPQSGTPASRIIPTAKSDLDPSAGFSKSLKTNVDEPTETEEQQLSVAEIKAKLFGANEDKAKKIFQGRSSSTPSTAFSTKADIMLASSAKQGYGPSKVSSSQPPLPSKPSASVTDHTDQTLRDYVSYSDGQVKKRSNIYDVLTDLEKTYEKLDMDLYDSGGWSYSRCDGKQSDYVTSDQTNEQNVKRLSITNVRMLEEQERDRQNPSLQYTKEWLSSGGNASPPRPHPTRFPNDPIIGQPSSESGSQPEAARNLPRKIADDMAVRKLKGNVGGKSIPDLASQSPRGSVSGTGNQPVPLRQHAAESPTSLERSAARRSLPVLSDQDLDRWRSILSHWSQDETGSGNDAVMSSSNHEPTSLPSKAPTFVASIVEVKPSIERPNITVSSSAVIPDKPCVSAVSIGIGTIPSDGSSTQVYKSTDQELPQRDFRPPREESRAINSRRPLMGTDSGYVECESDTHSRSSSAAAEAWRRRQSESLESDEAESHRNAAAEKIPTDIPAAEIIPSDKHSSSNLSLEKSEVSVSLESTEERTKRLQKLREEWFKSPSKSVAGKPEEETLKLGPTSVTDSVAAVAASGLRPNSADKKVKRSLYVSPLQNTALGFSKQPATDSASSCGDGKPESPRVSSFKMNMSSVPGAGVSRSTVVSKEETGKVPKLDSVSVMAVHLPSHVTEAGITPVPVVSQSISLHEAPRQPNFSQSRDLEVGFGSAFKPCISREDKQVSERQHGTRNITEVKTERVKIEPQQYEASKAFERTVVQPSKKTFQSESEQFRNQKQVIVEPNARITRHSTESRTERVYKVERSTDIGSKAAPKTAAYLFPPRRFGPEAETSDGELTDATDITLDVMVGANQGWRSMSENFSEFSDMEILSSANISTKSSQKSWKKDNVTSDKTTTVSSSTNMEERYSYKKESTRISQPPTSSGLSVPEPSRAAAAVSAAAHSGDGDKHSEALAAAKAEMKMYRRDRRAPKVDDDSQLERKRSIKELVSSFEGMTSPFMRVRPRSMEIRFSSSSSDESLKAEDEATAGRKTRKKCQLKASSSFKEFTRSGADGHPQVAKKSGDRS